MQYIMMLAYGNNSTILELCHKTLQLALLFILGVVGWYIVKKHHKQEYRHAKDIGKDG